MFELWNAIKLGRDHCDIQIILAPEDKKAFHDRINADGSDARAIDEALANVKSAEAEAFSQDDLDRIHTYIRSLPGGFATLDSTIKHHLRRWFVSHGGVKVAARAGRQSSTSSLVRANSSVEWVPFNFNRGLDSPGYIDVEGAQTATDGGGGGNAGSSGLGSLVIARRDGEPWGMGVKPVHYYPETQGLP